MSNFIYALNATIPVFLVILLGGLFRKWNLINEEFTKIANKLVFQVCLPVLLFQDIAGSNIREDFDIRFSLYCMIVTTLCFVGIWGFAELIFKDKTVIGAFVQGSFRSSVAILGLAFVKNVYSDVGMTPLMLVSCVPLYNIYSVIVLTFRSSEKIEGASPIKTAAKNILRNPIIIAIFLGIPFALFDVEFPQIVTKTMGSISCLASPLALLAIGAGFEGKKAIKKLKPTLIGSSMKLIIQPLLFLPVAVLMGFRNQELMAILIMLGSPTTSTSFIMAKQMKNDATLSASIVVVTTLVSAVTLTLWIYVLKGLSLL